MEIEAKDSGACLIVSNKYAVNRWGDTLNFEIRTDKAKLIKINMPNIDHYYKLRRFKYEEGNADEYFKFNLFVKKL